MDTSYRGGGHGRVLHMPSPTLSMAGGLWNLFWALQVALVIKNPPANARDIRDSGLILGYADPLEEEIATHSSILAWRIPWTEEPGGLQTMGSQRVRHD